MARLISRLPLVPLEITAIGVEPYDSATSAIEARVVGPSASAVALCRVPACVHGDRPLDVELVGVGLGAGASAAVSLASWISAHARLAISVDVAGQTRRHVSLPVAVRHSDSGWIVRALIRPEAWAGAASVTVVSLSIARRPLSCDCLPATLRVGYNHARVPAGAVYEAARAGDASALRVALEAGGSTEETYPVSAHRDNGRGRSSRAAE